MNHKPLCNDDESLLINPDVDQSDLYQLITDRLNQLESLALITSTADFKGLKQSYIFNQMELFNRTVNETQSLFQLYWEKTK